MKIKPCDADLPEVDAPKNPVRRRNCKDDFFLFCCTYFGDSRFQRNELENCFFDPLTFQREFCADLQALIFSPSHKRCARAAPRGIGKTTVAVLASIWAALYCHKRNILWFCVNETKAKERSDLMMNHLLFNKLLVEDFPEVCAPLRVEGPSDWVTGGKKLANGVLTLWRSIDGGNLGTIPRPDFIAIDDPEDTSTIRKTGVNVQSVTAQKRFDRIDKEICFLPERGKGSILMVTTIRSRGCLSDAYTDPETKADWEGKVYSAIDFGGAEFQISDAGKTREAHWRKFLAACGSKDSGKEPAESELANERDTASILGMDEKVFRALTTKRKKAVRYFAANYDAMRESIWELDPIRIPVWDFFAQVGSDERGKEIVWSELQNQPLEDPFTKQMTFTEKRLWTHQIAIKKGEFPNGFTKCFAGVVVGQDAIHFEVKSASDDLRRRHLVECGTIARNSVLGKLNSIESVFEDLRIKFRNYRCERVAVDIGTESGKDRGEWSESVAKFCALNRPWTALQKAAEWDVNQAHRAGFKNFCVEQVSNPYGVVKWNATHYKNRLASAYNDANHPITFFDPGEDDSLWKYIRSQTSEQYVQEFIPDKDASKSVKETWSPLPKFRNMTEFWKTASMVECLIDIAECCKPRERIALPPKTLGFRARSGE